METCFISNDSGSEDILDELIDDISDYINNDESPDNCLKKLALKFKKIISSILTV